MHRAVAMTELSIHSMYNIFKIVKKFPLYDLMFFIPDSISNYKSTTSAYIMEYKHNYELFLVFLSKDEMVMREREMFFYKKHIQMCLDNLHNNNIFFYFHIDDMHVHSVSKMPLLHNFDNACLLDFDSNGSRERVKKMMAKPIKNKYIPFSLFFFHFISFSLCSKKSSAPKEVSIYELYDNNESIFYGWTRDELKEVELIVFKGKNYEGIFDYYMDNKEIWFQWDNILLERGFMKLM